MALPDVQSKPHMSTLMWAVIIAVVLLGLYHLMAGRRR